MITPEEAKDPKSIPEDFFPILSLWTNVHADEYRWMGHSMAMPKYMMAEALLAAVLRFGMPVAASLFIAPESPDKAKEFADQFASYVEKYKESEAYKKMKERGEVE